MTARPSLTWVYDRIRVTVVLALYSGSRHAGRQPGHAPALNRRLEPV